MAAASVCLTMIVRDEAAIIERALAAAAPHIGCYAIHDTGSTDGTPELIETFLADQGIPGQVTHGPFVDFSQARNESLARARVTAAAHGATYLLLQDADMEFDADPGWADGLTAPGYHLEQRAADLRYNNLRLLHVAAAATYVGATHEVLVVDGAEQLDGARFIDHAAGSSRAVKFERDLALLERDLDPTTGGDPNDPRTVFYYAQTLRDLDRWREAYAAYSHRATLTGWDQERWYALWQAARCAEHVGSPSTANYLAAYDADPTRAEPLVDAARLERDEGRWHTALLYARAAAAIPLPGPGALFVDEATYAWRAWDEVAIAAWYAGHHDEGRAAAARAVALNPHDERLAANLAHFG